jgi:hypothetical protein
MIKKWYNRISFNKYPAGLFGLSQSDDVKKSEAELQISKWKAEAVGQTAKKLKEQAKKEWYKPYGVQLQQAAQQAELREKGAKQEIEFKQKEITALKTMDIAQRLSADAEKLNTKEAAQRAKIAAQQAAQAVKDYGDIETSKKWIEQAQEFENFIQETIKAEAEYEQSMRE